MPCLCVVLVGLDLMHLLGWVSIQDTHHHMGVLRKNFVVGIFGCMDFWVVTSTRLFGCCFTGCTFQLEAISNALTKVEVYLRNVSVQTMQQKPSHCA